MARCEECGFDWELPGDEVLELIGSLGRRYRAPLTRFLEGEDGDTLLRTRPAPEVWSALEYAGHMVEVLEFYEDRIERVLTEDRPQLTGRGWDPPLTGEIGVIADELAEISARLADRLGGLGDAQWERAGISSDSDEERSVLVLARRAAHDGAHHLLDIGRGLRHLRAGSSS